MALSDSNCSTAIVGGGCSGLLVAVHLFRNGYRGSVTVVEPRKRLGSGLAYSTSFDRHLLNVPAAKMSAIPGQPSDFLDWLRAGHLPEAQPDTFAPRKLFGQYLKHTLDQTLRDAGEGNFSHVRAEAIDASPDGAGARITLSDRKTIHAERVVLALGNPASCPTPGLLRTGMEDRWQLSPWLGDALRVRFSGERILLLGTGLTAVDGVLALHSQEMACEVHMLSRRGILPQVHNIRVPIPDPPVLRNRGNLRLLMQEVRQHIETARQADLCWRATVDSLRPISNDVWQELPAADQRRFLRHLKKYWEPHRHRMAPEIREQVELYKAAGTLEIMSGRLQEVCSRGRDTHVRVQLKRGGEREFDVDRIISCTGIQESYVNSPRPLAHALMKKGLAQPNILGIGFRTDANGALIDAGKTPSSVFFTLGPPRRGGLFETTAVPEIREQAEALALHLVKESDSQVSAGPN